MRNIRQMFYCVGWSPLLWLVAHLSLSSSHELEYSGLGCEGMTFEFRCPRGYFMTVTSAFYGRRNTVDCVLDDEDTGAFDTECSLPGAQNVISQNCRSTDCDLRITNETFTDPCPGTPKYMSVEFSCIEPEYSGLQCEGNKLSLECPEGFFINPALEVTYGREDDITCSHDSAILSTNCTSDTAMDTIVELCGAKKRCDLYVLASLLGDPCPGTYKYLEVSFSCSACLNDYGIDADCDRWESEGECASNYDWMQANCRKSCHGCDWKENCINEATDLFCDYWASTGECASNRDYMLANCTLSCNGCPSPGQIIEVPTPTPSTHACTVLQDPSDCGVWADVGECDLNPDWMLRECYGYCADHCASSCKRFYDYAGCDGGEAPPLTYCTNIHDNDTECDVWTRGNQCVDNFLFMLKNCAASCKGCFLGRQTCTSLHTNSSECATWAADGECETNPGFMRVMCRVACGNCPPRLGDTTTLPVTTVTDACENENRNDQCDFWASIGECETNSVFMVVECAKSCNVCQRPETTTTTVATTTTTPAPPTTTPYLPAEGVTDSLACEGSTLELTCEPGTYLRIYSATFGRTEGETCSQNRTEGLNDTDCGGHPDTHGKLRTTCDGRESCLPAVTAYALGDGCPGTYKYLETKHGCEECVNANGDDSNCKYWAGRDECALNRVWMYNNCFKACTGCAHSGCSNHPDEDADCDLWAMTNECQNNRGWMEENCRQSCRACPTEAYVCDAQCIDHGVCIGDDVCACDSGYTGDTCADFRCDARNHCGSHGTCIAPNLCECAEGWTGAECNEFSCGNVSECSGNGVCVGPDVCLCHAHWSGSGCTNCSVDFRTGPSCLPCPACVHGTCQQADLQMSHSYKGCYEDDLSFVTEENSGAMNTAACMQTCLDRGSLYAATTTGRICACGDNINGFVVSSGCNLVCAGGVDREICGGQTAMSVWQVYEGTCLCDGPNWNGTFCDTCSSGHEGAECVPRTPATTAMPTTDLSTGATTPTATTQTAATTPAAAATPTSVAATQSTTASTAQTTPDPSDPEPISPDPSIRSSTVISTSSTIAIASTSPARSSSGTTVRGPSTKHTGSVQSSSTTAFPATTKPLREATDNDIQMILVLDKVWKELYNNTECLERHQFITWLSRELTAFYQNNLQPLRVEGVRVMRLREGSVIVDHVILVYQNMTTADKRDSQCDIVKILDAINGKMDNDLRGFPEPELAKNCETKDKYCLNGGELDFDTYGYWICHCPEKYFGPRCDNTLTDTIILIVIIVVCLLVPLVVIMVICCVIPKRCSHREFSPSTRDYNNGTARSFEFHSMQKGAISRARKSSSKQLFSSTNSSFVDDDDDDFMPRKI